MLLKTSRVAGALLLYLQPLLNAAAFIVTGFYLRVPSACASASHRGASFGAESTSIGRQYGTVEDDWWAPKGKSRHGRAVGTEIKGS